MASKELESATVTLTSAVTEGVWLEAAVTVVSPGATAVIRPVWSTVATLSSAEDQLMVLSARTMGLISARIWTVSRPSTVKRVTSSGSTVILLAFSGSISTVRSPLV